MTRTADLIVAATILGGRRLAAAQGAGEDVAGSFATDEGMALYRALGFEENGWVSRRLGGP